MSRPSPSLLVIVLAAGCADPYSVDDYRRDLAAAHCQRMHDCCTPADYNDWWTSSVATQDCQTVWENRDLDAIHEAIEGGTLAFDPVAAHACLDALRAQSCSEFEPAYRYRETYCESPLRGLVPDGGACAQDLECASASCALDAAQHRTVCAPAIASGQVCAASTGASESSGCERPEACQADGTCGLGLPAGASCATDYECIDHWCKGGGLSTRGTCYRACDGT